MFVLPSIHVYVYDELRKKQMERILEKAGSYYFGGN
jgi:hypothetical protein